MSVAGVSSQPDASVGPAHPVVRTAHRNLQVASNRMIKPLYGETAIAAALPASAGAPALNGAAKNGAANNGAAKNGAAKNGAAKVATGAAKKAPAAAARKAGTAGAAKTAVGTVGVKGGSAAAAGAGAGLMTGGLALVAYGGMRAAQTGIHLYDRARHQTVGAVLGGIGQQTGPRPQPLAPHEGPSFTSASWAYAGRVSKAGMKAVRGQRVKPLEQDGGSKPRATPPRTPPAHQRVKEPAKS
jgi:hypothetical protein